MQRIGEENILKCSIDGCLKEAVGRGWCHAHWKKWKAYGNPLARQRMSQFATLEQRFHDQFIPVTESGCWLWTGALTANGYGCLGDKYKTRSAHKVSYELHVGEVPSGMHVCHKCDVKSCVNPEHLYVGTGKQNYADARDRGRLRPRRGETNPIAKLTTAQVLEIKSSNETGVDLARRFGLSPSTVCQIRKGLRWKHLDESANHRRL